MKRAQEVRPREGGSNLNLGYLYMNTQPRLLGLLHQHRDRPRAQPGAPIGARRAQTTSAPTSIPPAATAPYATRCSSARRPRSASAIDRKPRRLASGAASSSARTRMRSSPADVQTITAGDAVAAAARARAPTVSASVAATRTPRRGAARARPRRRRAPACRRTARPRPIRIDAVSRFEAPLTGTWTTTRQDDAANAYCSTTPRGSLDVACGNGPTLEPFRVLFVFRFEAPLIGTWTTIRQDDTANAYRLTTPRGRLDGAGEYGRLCAAPRRWCAGRAAAHSPHALAASAHISVSVRRPTLASAGSRRPRCGSASKARLFQALQAKTKCPLSALTVPSRNTTCSGRTGTILSD